MTGLLDLANGTQTKPQGQNWFAGFAQSALSSPLELFGMSPAPEVSRWRETHPWSGLGSELIGTTIPYAGWGSLARKIGPMEEFITTTFPNIEKAPIVTGAAREMARFAPFEAARAGIATANGQDFGKELLQSGVNLGLAGVGGGVFEGLASAGRLAPRKSLVDIAPTVDPSAPLQIRLRQLKTALDQGDVTDSSAALNRFNNWITEARTEVPSVGQRHLAPLDGEGGGQLARDVERLFFKPDNVPEATKAGKGSIVRTFSQGRQGFRSQADWTAAATEAQLPETFPVNGQYFRLITAGTNKAAKTLQATADKLTAVGDWRIGQESDGNYVVLRKLGTVSDIPKSARDAGYQEWMRPWLDRVNSGEKLHSVFKDLMMGSDGEVATKPQAKAFYQLARQDFKPPESSRWVAFKTDDPSLFSPELRAWKRMDERWASWLPVQDADLKSGGEILQAGLKRNQELPLVAYDEMQKTGKLAGTLDQALGPLGQGIKDFHSHYLTPAMNQFARSPLANWIFSGARDLFNIADLKTNDAMLGARKISEPKDIVASIWSGSHPSGEGIQGIINGLNNDQIQQYYKLVGLRPTNDQLTELYARGAVDEGTYNAYKAVEAIVTKAFESVNATKRALGQTVSKIKEGHGGISRRWEGGLKMGLMDEGGNLVAIADANNQRALEQRANFIEQRLADEGITGLKRGAVWNGEGAPPRELRVVVRDPGFLKSEHGVRGFKWDFGQHGSRSDLLDEIHRNLQWRYREEASLAMHGLYDNPLQQLQRQDPRTWTAVAERLNQLQGEVGPVTTLINRVVDPVLSPILGRGAAGKIVDAVNQGFWHLQLGFFNLGYPVANLVGILQTILPEVSYVMHGAPERLAGYYSWQLVSGSKGPIGVMSALDPLKLFAKGVQGLFRPDAELLSMYGRAINEGVIDPKFLEEFAGQKAARIARLRDVLKGREGFPQFISAISGWMPSSSERLSRAMAFSTAQQVGKDVLGLSGDGLYAFAKKFTDRTMYAYSMSDRANILTSPVGRLFGSMKNWISHYISNMMIYAGEAGRGNVGPLAWQMATTGAIGGLSAVPLAPFIAGAWADQVEHKKLLEWIYAGMGQKAGDALYMGLPAVLGLSLSSATASPIRDANMLYSFAIWDRAKAMGRSVGAAVDYWQSTGQHPASSEIARGAFARAFAPKIIYRATAIYSSPGLESLTTGYPVIDQVNPWNKVLYTMGFQPPEIERAYAEFETLLKDKTAMQQTVVRYGAAMAEALKAGDSKAIENVSTRALASGVDLSSVLRSANARINKDSQGMLERNFSAQQRLALSSVIGEQ